MIRVVSCVFEQHNLWLVLVAAGMCLSACAGVFFVIDGLSASEKKQRRRWLFLAGLLAGVGTWATHFIAMLGYNPGIAIQFDLGLTLLSAVSCVVGAWGAFEILDRFPSASGRIVAGVLLGGAIVTMHYIGMFGVEAAAQRVWAVDLVLASWFFSAAFAIAALHAFSIMPAGRARLIAATSLLVLAIVSLHFTAMGALTLVADPRLATPIGALDRPLLAVTIAAAAAATLLIGVILALADRRLTAVQFAAAKHAATLALHDALTGLPNRRHLRETLHHLLADPEARLAVIAVDLDRFKPVNDLYGHAVGDELLIKIGKLLADEMGEEGFVARLGGDEFILILPCESADALIPRLSALVAKFDTPIRLNENEASVGATLGVALAPADGVDSDQLLRRADVALYRAKDDGRGRFAFYETGMDARVRERAALEHDLRVAIRSDQIVPHFQPLVHLGSNETNGYEILARWTHAERGAVPAPVFIKIAEETGMIGELTFNVLRRACREALDWPGAPRLALNIAPAQLQDPALPQKILRVLSEYGFPPGRLEIEITEDALVTDFESARAILLSLKNLGMRIALDDFGTGYSSLRHLRELPFDALKIDRSFVHSMNDSAESMTIVRTIVQLAKSLGLGVTAEGIETADQAAELQSLGCDRGQGFLLGRPTATHAEEPATESAPEAVNRTNAA